MSKKVRILISALVVAVLLTVGATATVLAEGEEDEDTPTVTEEETKDGLLDRVADILGIDKEDLVSAFEQAQQELRESAFVDRINQAVEEGLITQEQADEITEWWQQRPDEAFGELRGQGPGLMERSMFKHTLRFRAMPRLHMQNGFGKGFCPESPEQAD